MVLVVTVRHQVAIAGRITDAQTGTPIAGANVQIATGPAAWTDALAKLAAVHGAAWATLQERPDRRRTSADGHFHFLDLPNGAYQLTASLPLSGSRYGTTQVQASVARDETGKIAMATADVALPTTMITGRITGPGLTPVAMATARLKGSGESTYSDSQGRYRLSAIEAGTRAVQISAQGFQPAVNQAVLGQPGASQNLDFTLVPTGP